MLPKIWGPPVILLPKEALNSDGARSEDKDNRGMIAVGQVGEKDGVGDIFA